MSFREHCELLQDVVRDRFGVLHSKIIASLWSYGPMTLYDLATQLRLQTFDVVPPRTSSDVAMSSTTPSATRSNGAIDDGSVKFAVAVLHEHSILSFTDADKCYRVRLGYGLTHCVQPILLRFVHQRYGDAGSTIASIVLEYGALPRSTLAHLATQRRPALHDAIHPTTDQLRLDGVLVAVYDAAEETAPSEDLPALKRLRKDDWVTAGSAAASSSLAILALNHSAVLHKIRAECMAAFLQPRYDDSCLSILRAAIALDTAKLGSSGQDTSFPARVDMSNSVSLRQIREQLPFDVQPDAFIAGVTRLSSGSNPVFLRGGGATSDEVVRVRYDSIIEQHRMEICEQVIFARYGILGVRIVKLLLKNQAMEDKFLAEEAIATLHQVREVLAGLIRDGTVRQQEIPKVLSADRQPKQSIFLWVISKQLLLSTVAMHIAKSIRTARFRLFVEEERLSKFREDLTSGADPNASPLDAKLHQQRVAGEHAVRALKLSLFGLMQQMLVMELFGAPSSA